MAYIGNTVQNQGFAPAVDYFSGNGVTVTFTLSRPVASVAQMIVAVDNVIQNPSSAFTVSGNSITFTSAPLSGTNNIWVEYTSLITTYAAISQSPSVIGDITASGGYLAVGNFGASFIDGTIVDYVTGNGRITTGPADGLTIYNGGTSARNALLTLDANGSAGLGVTPNTWYSSYRPLQLGTYGGCVYGRTDGNDTGIVSNAYRDSGATFRYTVTSTSSRYSLNSGNHTFLSAASGTAGDAISYSTVMNVGKDTTLALQGASTVSGTGISFPATQSASTDPNTLDDYEEGTWTPGLGCQTGSLSSVTYSDQTGSYVKIGKTVYVTALLGWSSFSIGSGSGDLWLTGLPFGSTVASALFSAESYFVNWPSTGSLIGQIGGGAGQTYLFFRVNQNNGNWGSILISSQDTAEQNYFRITGTYIAS